MATDASARTHARLLALTCIVLVIVILTGGNLQLLMGMVSLLTSIYVVLRLEASKTVSVAAPTLSPPIALTPPLTPPIALTPLQTPTKSNFVGGRVNDIISDLAAHGPPPQMHPMRHSLQNPMHPTQHPMQHPMQSPMQHPTQNPMRPMQSPMQSPMQNQMPQQMQNQMPQQMSYPGAIDAPKISWMAAQSGITDRVSGVPTQDANFYNYGRSAAPRAGTDDDANDEDIDGDEAITYQARSRNDAVRVTTGTMRRRRDLDKYLREEVDEAEERIWWGRHEQ